MNLLTAALVAGAIVALVPASVLCVECLAALARARRPEEPPQLVRRPRVVVLVPAHNEAGVVGPTVAALRTQLAPEDRLYVIADNCSDDTATEARRAGAQVWERHDPDRRGKGFAISFALEQLDAEPPEVVVLVDADCRLSPGAIDTLARTAAFSARPVQAQYLLKASDASGLSAVSSLAFLVRNLVRPLGLKRLGMPCHLTGSGMAFPWQVLRQAPQLRDNLVEDLVMGLEMAIAGTPPIFCPAAEVKSELPATRESAVGQRRRWEHGQLATLVAYVPRLLLAGLRQRKLRLVALAADLAVPPLSLLVVLVIVLWTVSLAAYALGLAAALPALLLTPALGLVAVAIAAAWFAHGQEAVAAGALLVAPFYVLWKLPLYAAFFLKRRQRGWVRTERAAPSTTEPS